MNLQLRLLPLKARPLSWVHRPATPVSHSIGGGAGGIGISAHVRPMEIRRSSSHRHTKQQQQQQPAINPARFPSAAAPQPDNSADFVLPNPMPLSRAAAAAAAGDGEGMRNRRAKSGAAARYGGEAGGDGCPRNGVWVVAWIAGAGAKGAVAALRRHWLAVGFFACMLAFMAVEYTIPMVASPAPPVDIGFAVTTPLHAALAVRPNLNSVLAALNTVFVAMQGLYILYAFLVEGRPRATVAALFMFPCRGVLGCSTQLPVPEGFLGSGMDFPVGNVSFFLFFSGHVAGAVIASLDMRRHGRPKMALAFDGLNLLQVLRLLASRGHYTIDLAAGVGAGYIFDVLAGAYLEKKQLPEAAANGGAALSNLEKRRS